MPAGRCLNCGRSVHYGPDGDEGECVCHDPDSMIDDTEEPPMHTDEAAA